MKFKPIFIFFIILGVLSVSLVMAAEFEDDLYADNGHNDPVFSESSIQQHRETRNIHYNIDNHAPKNDFTIDTFILNEIEQLKN